MLNNNTLTSDTMLVRLKATKPQCMHCEAEYRLLGANSIEIRFVKITRTKLV